VPLTADDVARLRVRPDGRPRLVVAYMSVGEAEEYRFYWQDAWKTAPPAWLGPENCAWPQAHRVRFWEDGWRDLVYRGPDAYLKRIIAAGFDGVYLDRVDIHEAYDAERPQARAEMIGFVEELAATARKLQPGFLAIPQNGEELTADRGYRRAIDGLGKESLLYGIPGTGKRNSSLDVARSLQLAQRMASEMKPVLVVEYLQDAGTTAATRKEIAALGLVPTFEARALDGTDPLAPTVALADDHGSPEFVAKACPPGTAW
jgi:cysteinyl-tRNA synthetase, unknown class